MGHVTLDNLGPIFERLEQTGGEVAIGLIRDRSDAPLVRLLVPPPPAAPVFRTLPQNVFAAAAARRRDDAERARYDARLRTWRAENSARMSAFASAVAPLLAEANDAPQTDIRSALLRCDLFLAEPTTFAVPPKNAIVFLSDGIETVSDGDLPPLRSGAQILLVNGTGSEGALARLHPIRFEALEAALRFLAEEGGRHV